MVYFCLSGQLRHYKMNTLCYIMLPTFLLVLSLASFLNPHVVHADTSTKLQKAIQAVCDRATTSYNQRSLSSFMEMFSRSLVTRNVSGRKFSLQQYQAEVSKDFATKNLTAIVHCTVSQVISQGNQVSRSCALALCDLLFALGISPGISDHTRLSRADNMGEIFEWLAGENR